MRPSRSTPASGPDDAVSKAIHHLPPGGTAAGSADGVRVRVFESVIEIESLEHPWRTLTPETAAPFQTFTWNLAWYRYFGVSHEAISVFVVERGDEMIGILPCYRRGRQLRLAGDDSGDYQDIIAGSDADAAEALSAIFGLARETFPGYHFFFRKVSSRSFLHRYLEGPATCADEMIVYSRNFAPCPEVSIDGGLETYLTSIPSRRRQDMRRALRRFDQAMPAARVEMIRSLEIRVSDLENVAEFHAAHFRKDGVSPMQSEALMKMLGEVAKDPEVGLQLGALVDQGELIAIDVGFARGRRYYGYLTGFDPEFRKWAPGKCLLLKRIDAWVNDDEVEMLDFLSGDESYKTGFTHGESYEVLSYHWMPNQIQSRARRATLVAERFGRRVAKKAISKIVLPR